MDAAVALTGRRAGVLDALNGRLCVGDAGRPAAIVVSRPATTARVIATLTATRLRGRETGIVDVGDAEVVAASVDDAGGRIGASLARPGRGAVATARRAGGPAAVVRRGDQQRAAARRARDAEPARLCRARAAALVPDDATRRPPRPCDGRASGRAASSWPWRRARSPAGTSGPRRSRRRSRRSLEQAGLSSRSSVIGRSAADRRRGGRDDRRDPLPGGDEHVAPRRQHRGRRRRSGACVGAPHVLAPGRAGAAAAAGHGRDDPRHALRGARGPAPAGRDPDRRPGALPGCSPRGRTSRPRASR